MVRVFLAIVCLSLSALAALTPRPLFDATIATGDGKKVRLSQYRGKVMVVAIISTTCDHCLASMDLLSRLQMEYGPKGFQVVAVAADDMAAKMVGPLTRVRQPAYPLGYLDQENTMRLADFKKNDHPYAPMYLFVDKKGTVRFQYFANEDFFKAEEKNTRYLIEALLKQ